MILDMCNLPKHSVTDKEMSVLERLTFGWFWTDDPRYSEIDVELEIQEGKTCRIT
jgi:hypothetical protein